MVTGCAIGQLRLSTRQQRRVSGQRLERVVGHVTYISLVRRPLFIRVCGGVQIPAGALQRANLLEGQWPGRTRTLS